MLWLHRVNFWVAGWGGGGGRGRGGRCVYAYAVVALRIFLGVALRRGDELWAGGWLHVGRWI